VTHCSRKLCDFLRSMLVPLPSNSFTVELYNVYIVEPASHSI